MFDSAEIMSRYNNLGDYVDDLVKELDLVGEFISLYAGLDEIYGAEWAVRASRYRNDQPIQNFR